MKCVDEVLLVSKAKEGDSNALTELIKRYSNFVLQKSRSFNNVSGIDSDDLYQEGMLGLLSAVYTFDESRDVKFSTYASTVVSNKMLSSVRNNNAKKNLPLNSYVQIDEETEVVSQFPTPEETVIYNEELTIINKFIENNLSKSEKRVFKLNLLGLSYKEIAEILDCTEKYVDNALQRIRRKLRNLK